MLHLMFLLYTYSLLCQRFWCTIHKKETFFVKADKLSRRRLYIFPNKSGDAPAFWADDIRPYTMSQGSCSRIKRHTLSVCLFSVLIMRSCRAR